MTQQLTTTNSSPATVKPIEIDAHGQAIFRDLGQRRRYLVEMLATGQLPAHIKTVQQLEMAWDLLTQMGLPVVSYLHQTVFVNGKLGVMSDVLMAACERTGQMEWLDVYFLDEKNERLEKGKNEATFKVFCAVVTAKRKDRPEVWARYTLGQARTANLTKNRVWESFPEDMLMHRARSRVLRQLFSDSIGGVRVKELDEYVSVMDESGRPLRTPDGQDIVTKRNVSAGELNEMFGGKQHQPPTPQTE